MIVPVTVTWLASCAFVAAQTKPVNTVSPAAVVERGKSVFGQNCAFCHGREGFGGESGPNLMDSELVTSDVRGNKIGPVVRNGRPETGMPAFKLSLQEITDLAAFLHAQKKRSDSRPGGRRGVSVSDLQTGNVEAGKQYFNGAGTCSSCHSPTGDLAGIATRYRGLELEKRMLYPRHAKATVTVTTPSGQTVSGELSYQDEFTIGLTDADGGISPAGGSIRYTIHAPAEAHAELLPKYTDDDVHNLMAYLQTLL
jgi:cytochrome c oxidase cbb3-type subunit 3